jgi:hypothetical protein
MWKRHYVRNHGENIPVNLIIKENYERARKHKFSMLRHGQRLLIAVSVP